MYVSAYNIWQHTFGNMYGIVTYTRLFGPLNAIIILMWMLVIGWGGQL